ncbi:hypothetical protein M3Y95_00878300 [Aphelenchoides besseyi]|nr:hypothetical protein M3Y95_00878300 [Aphelenchoides besseyi]
MSFLVDHVFLLAVYQFLFAVSAVLMTVGQCAKKKSPNAPATPASAPPPVAVPPTGAPLVSTTAGVGPSVNTAVPPAANAKSGMNKPEEKKDDKKPEEKPKSKKEEKKEAEKKEDGGDNYEDVVVGGDAPPPPA